MVVFKVEELGLFDFVFGGSLCNDFFIVNLVRCGICGEFIDWIRDIKLFV